MSINTQLLGVHGSTDPHQYRCTAPILIAAAGAQTQQFNFGAQQQSDSRFIDSALSMYVDNGGQATSITFTFSTGQQIVVQADTQGYFNILQGNPISFSVSTSGANVGTFMLMNFLIPPFTWTANSL